MLKNELISGYVIVLLTKNSQDYTTCIRQEEGFCTNSYHQNADTTPDTFDVYSAITAGTTGAEVGTSQNGRSFGIQGGPSGQIVGLR